MSLSYHRDTRSNILLGLVIPHLYFRYIYLLVKILRCQEEVVERHKVSFQQPHQQHQIDAVCKLAQQQDQASER